MLLGVPKTSVDPELERCGMRDVAGGERVELFPLEIKLEGQWNSWE